jgi:hypothetical protein
MPHHVSLLDRGCTLGEMRETQSRLAAQTIEFACFGYVNESFVEGVTHTSGSPDV